MQKKDAQPLNKTNLLDLLHGDVANLCEKVKFNRKQEIQELMEAQKKDGSDPYAQLRPLADQLRKAAGELEAKQGDVEESKGEAHGAQKAKKVDYDQIVQQEVTNSPWLARLNDKNSSLSKMLSGAVNAF